MSSENATVAEQEYLEIMFWLEEAGLPMTGANIARAMQLSPPTVHEMIGRLRGTATSTERRKSLGFTDRPRARQLISAATGMIERFLTDVLHIPWDEVHEEAERLEHAMTPVLEERMRRRSATRRPAPTATRSSREQRAGLLLADVELGAGVRVLRFENEAEEILHYLRGWPRPGPRGEGRELRQREVVVGSDEGGMRSRRSVAETVSVRADPARLRGQRCRISWSSRPTARPVDGCKPAPGGVLGRSRAEKHATLPASLPDLVFAVYPGTGHGHDRLRGRGFRLPPCGSSVTITTATPFMWAIRRLRLTVPVGDEQGRHRFDLAFTFDPSLEHLVGRQLVDAR